MAQYAARDDDTDILRVQDRDSASKATGLLDPWQTILSRDCILREQDVDIRKRCVDRSLEPRTPCLPIRSCRILVVQDRVVLITANRTSVAESKQEESLFGAGQLTNNSSRTPGEQCIEIKMPAGPVDGRVKWRLRLVCPRLPNPSHLYFLRGIISATNRRNAVLSVY